MRFTPDQANFKRQAYLPLPPLPQGRIKRPFFSTQLLTIFDMQFELKPKKSPTIYMLKQVEPQTLT